MTKLIDERSSRAEIASFQRSINRRGKTRGVSILADGEWGRQTAAAELSVAHRLGMLRVSGSQRVAEHRQKIIRSPGFRTAAEKARGARVVRAWRRKLKAQGTLGERAWREAGKLLGVMEQGGNNRGPVVSKLIRDNGGDVGEPWCGDFVAYCYRQAGSKAVNRSWASVAALRWVAGVRVTRSPKVGALVRFLFDHVGLFGHFTLPSRGTIRTREGNTGPSGAVSDGDGGDGVYEKSRSATLVNDYLEILR